MGLLLEKNSQPSLFDDGAAGERGVGDVLPSDGGGGCLDTRGNVSIEWFAKKQAEYREAGIASASEFWKARGVKFP